jgi:hypothetical protein
MNGREGEVLKIGTYIRNKQPDVLDELHKPKNKKHKHRKHRRSKKEHLSFSDFQNMMQDEHVYKRHKGAWRQVR